MRDLHQLTIKRVVRETPEAISVAFDIPPELTEVFRYRPGQHLTLCRSLEGEELRRTYSICSSPAEPEIRVAIKRVASGRFSNLANDSFAAGQRVTVLPPSGRFVVPEGDERHLVAFAAGVGITPILGMISHVLHSEQRSGFTLVYGNRSVSQILFLEELQALKDRYLDRFRLIHVLSGEGEEQMSPFSGRIDRDRVEDLGKTIDLRAAEHVFLCGPGSMIETVRETLIEMGVEENRIHRESFTPEGVEQRTPTVLSEDDSGHGARITAIVDGVQYRFEAHAGESIIEAAVRCGVRLPWSCRGGMCCTCRARVVSGEASMRLNYSLEPWELEAGFTLTCQAVPVSDDLVVDYDAM